MTATTTKPSGQLAADIITDALAAGLTHPGNPLTKQPPMAIPLPMFRTMGMPPKMADNVRSTIRLIAEAIVHDLQADGRLKLITAAEVEQLRDENESKRPHPTVVIECPHGHSVIEVVARPHVRLQAGQLAAFIEAAQCQH